MGNHRADRGSRRTSVSPLNDQPRSKGGARRAAKRKPTTADVEMTPRASSSTQAPVPATAVAPPSPAGKRRAGAEPGRPSYFKRVPAIPAMAGLATIAVAAVGATTTMSGAATSAASDVRPTASQVMPASALSGSVSDGSTFGAGAGGGADTSTRDEVVSRSGSRGDQQGTDAELLEDAEVTFEQREEALAAQVKDAASYAEEVAKNAWVLPTSGYRLTAGFGQSSGLWSSTHTGLDFAAGSGTPIVAVAGGTVTETGYDGAYGNKTVITLDDGAEIWFCHQTTIDVSVGDVVRAGEQIGTVGSTGNSTGPHLHLEVRPGGGDPVDPFSALVEHGVQP